jgi:hypothetical protein
MWWTTSSVSPTPAGGDDTLEAETAGAPQTTVYSTASELPPTLIIRERSLVLPLVLGSSNRAGTFDTAGDYRPLSFASFRCQLVPPFTR